MRVAVWAAYEVPYSETPDAPVGPPRSGAYWPSDGSGFWAAWEEWATARGQRWWRPEQGAPIYLRSWIAVVDPPSRDDNLRAEIEARGDHRLHAVAMRKNRLHFDGAQFYRAIRPEPTPPYESAVYMALALIPADAETPKTYPCWPFAKKRWRVALTTPAERRQCPPSPG